MASSIIILAAGQGTRMKSKTPKVMHQLAGKPMLFHAIDAAREVSDDITIVLYHQASLIQKSIEESYDNIKFHTQDVANYPGTGGALRDIKIKHSQAVILNGDMPLITKDSLEKLASNSETISMSILELNNPTGYGRVVIKDGSVQKIVEQKDCTTLDLNINSVNAGVYSIPKNILEEYIPKLDNNNAQKEYYLTDIIQMAKNNNVMITPITVPETEFKGVNSRVDLAKADEIMQQRIRAYWMSQGVTMKLPETIYIDSRVKLNGECILENGVTLLGQTYIAHSHIKAHSIIEDATITNSSVGPLARIRPKTTLDNTHIGNFVEIKKSTLTGVKAGHLSYIGDSQIDTGTNVGAGTITCNYDGINKYETTIGKNVFIGSDTQIIAPVNIEDNVIIAAGSTITKDIKSGTLAISRTPMKLIENFYYKFFKKETSCN